MGSGEFLKSFKYKLVFFFKVNALFGCLFLKSGGGSVEAITLSGLKKLFILKIKIFGLIFTALIDEGCAQEKRVKGERNF